MDVIKINDELLDRIGLGALAPEDKNLMLRHIYETLEGRVGQNLAASMSESQLDEFETYFEAGDDAGAFQWLNDNFPDYQKIVQAEYDRLLEQVEAEVPALVAELQADDDTAHG